MDFATLICMWRSSALNCQRWMFRIVRARRRAWSASRRRRLGALSNVNHQHGLSRFALALKGGANARGRRRMNCTMLRAVVRAS